MLYQKKEQLKNLKRNKMNNIHLIPTRKTSKIFKVRSMLYFEEYPDKKVVTGNQHIYITNDSEIKNGDWYYHLERKTVHNTSEKADYFVNNTIYNEFKKIILTTDQSLNNVQAIGDDFLKWFVKNPSCKEVGVELIDTFKKTNEVYVDEITGGNYYEIIKKYKIIIPKEEIKQEKLYTEKEVIEIVKKSRETGLTAEYLIEQFKKK